jgi:hypothetical protein
MELDFADWAIFLEVDLELLLCTLDGNSTHENLIGHKTTQIPGC